MALMRWTEAMSVGIPELDADHRILIKVINELTLNAGSADREKVLRQCLYGLLRYAEFHFGREEKVMEACGFPAVEHHKDEHLAFTQHVQELAGRIDSGEAQALEVVNDELTDYLKNWLIHHILIEDMAYRGRAEQSREAKTAARAFRASEIWWGR
jgi:hemerythrin-like metal-binding protein